ncbi:glycerophosphodiester phosphodiesterase family protein [Streptomyces sp. ME03-5709C]|nr:glycerophosphodiester phosphodiesterase family protein [Streptomyces sp. ME03-5709C]
MPSAPRRAVLGAAAALTLALTGASLALVPPEPASAATDEPEVVLDANFDDGVIPAGWKTTNGNWSVQDGRLVGRETAAGVPTSASYPRVTFGQALADYRLEADVTILETSGADRWGALGLDMTPGGTSPFQIVMARSWTTGGTGINFLYRTAQKTWDYQEAGAAPTDLDVGNTVHVAVEVHGTSASVRWNGTEVLRSTHLVRTADGIQGLLVSGTSTAFDNVRVTKLPALPVTPPPAPGEWPFELRKPGVPAFVLSHRGNDSVAPENTMPAIITSTRAGADYLEFDIVMTKDGVPVVMHDDSVDRTTTGTGNVRDMTLAQIKALDAGSKFDPLYAGTRVPTLEEVLAYAERTHSGLLLEYKGNWALPQVQLTVDMLQRYHQLDTLLVQSFSTSTLKAFSQLAPDVPTILDFTTPPADPLGALAAVGAEAINVTNTAAVNPDFLAKLHGAGKGVLVYTVNSAADWRRLTDLGVDGIITDRPDRLAGWFEREVATGAPQPHPAPTVTVLAPTADAVIEHGGTVTIAAGATDQQAIALTLDGASVANGAVVSAAELAYGTHTVVATATGAGGEASATGTFTVGVTVDGLRSRLAALDVAPGKLQQLLTALAAHDWKDLTATIGRVVTDKALRADLTAQVQVLAG